MMHRILIVPLVFFTIMFAVSAMADEKPCCEDLLKQQQEALASLEKENALLQEKIAAFEGAPHISCDVLALKNYRRLREIAGDIKAQRQSMADFEAYVKWMTANLSGYSKYIEAGSFAAGFAKALPIPYAGQASVLTKFISQGVLSLNSASVSISRYLGTSKQFIATVESLDQAAPDVRTREISNIAHFADQKLLKDMNDVRARLAATAELSSSTLSFLESLNHYVGSTDEYWNKTKSILTRKEADKNEKSFLSQSIHGLKNRAGNFNARLKRFEESSKKEEPLIKSLGTYDELIREMAMTTAKNGGPGK
ncbi:MAG TPA: hypothetical protein VJ161_09520 [Geobacteraceae bacterium]|nr:hypothetical protein [Geobacteraceae bacterium]